MQSHIPNISRTVHLHSEDLARYRAEDNIKEMGHEGVDWIHVTQDKEKSGGLCEQHNEPKNYTKGRKFLNQLSK
jgi:hypothetical protein